MLRGRRGALAFVVAWAGITLLLVLIVVGVFWLGGSFRL